MSGQGGRPKGSGRPLPKIPHVEERKSLIVAYYLAGHSVRETARIFRMAPSLVGEIVKDVARSKSDAGKMDAQRRAAGRGVAVDNG